LVKKVVPIATGLAGQVAMSGGKIAIKYPQLDSFLNTEVDLDTGHNTKDQTLVCVALLDSFGKTMGVIQTGASGNNFFTPPYVENSSFADNDTNSCETPLETLTLSDAVEYIGSQLGPYLERILSSLSDDFAFAPPPEEIHHEGDIVDECKPIYGTREEMVVKVTDRIENLQNEIGELKSKLKESQDKNFRITKDLDEYANIANKSGSLANDLKASNEIIQKLEDDKSNLQQKLDEFLLLEAELKEENDVLQKKINSRTRRRITWYL